MSSIPYLVEQAVYGRLSDESTGLNVNHEAIASIYEVDPLNVNWDDDGPNFAFGNVAPELIESNNAFSYPFITMEAQGGQFGQAPYNVKFSQFNGPVTGIVQIHGSFIEQAFSGLFSRWASSIVDAMYATMNSQDLNPNWAQGLLWNGRMNFQKLPAVEAAGNWRKTVLFQFTFTVVV